MNKLQSAILVGAVGAALPGVAAQAQPPMHHDSAYGQHYQDDYGPPYSSGYDDPRTRSSRPGYYASAAWAHDIGAASHELADRAAHLAHVVRGVEGYGHLTEDAFALARRAEQFHLTVAGRVTHAYVLSHFRALQSDWEHLNEELSRAHHLHHSPHVAEDFAELHHAYAEVARAVRRDHLSRSPRRSYRYEGRATYRPPYERPYVRVKPEVRVRVRPVY